MISYAKLTQPHPSSFLLSLSTLLTVALLLLASSSHAAEKVVVYNWSDYIPEGVLAQFTKDTGIEVEYSTYDSNNVMYRKLKVLKGRGYDVIVPSTSLVERMRKEGLIQNIQRDRLDNFKHLNSNLLDKEYDPDNRFSVPYVWGSTGIFINRDKLKDTKVERWRDLWSFQWNDKLLVVDDMRDIFSVALMLNGHSLNSTDGDELADAYQQLNRLKNNINQFSGSPTELLASGEADIGIAWNGDVVTAQMEQPSLEYIYPEEGVGVWIDSFVIPTRAENVENAHTFINFMLRPDIAALCTTELGYATPNLSGQALLKDSVKNNKAIFPSPEVLKRAIFQRDLGQAMTLYERYWSKLKESRSLQ